MTNRYTLAQLNADSDLAARVRELVYAISDGDMIPENNMESLTAVAIIQAKRRAGIAIRRPNGPATFEGTVTIKGETFAHYTGVTL